ncbi:MAG: carboxypeptidase-like regulatory domain-containing protein [Bacteroidales bacterium]|nr:carboxypeptidase-like regulatory domain-containing protein [Bacteroidales bacterium]
MRFRSYLIFLFLFVSITKIFPQATFTVSGRVLDSKTKEALAFVNIVINQSNYGGTTDIDGKFRFRYQEPVGSLKLSYVGYESMIYSVGTKTQDLVIYLNRKEIELQEVEILPGINPAHRIISNAVNNRDMNDPEKQSSFSYTMYEKTIFTIDADTIFGDSGSDTTAGAGSVGLSLDFEAGMDSIRQDSAMMDSATHLIETLISKQYLFLMENVTKRKFLFPDRSYNDVVATKMSGFKDPIFVFLATQIQSFSFYKPFITIFQSSYVNPISGGSLGKYFFKIEDTTFVDHDTVFIISFRPKKGTNFDGLKGTISISSHKWGIQNVIAEPASQGGLQIRIQQMYELVDGENWFPVQLNTFVVFNNLKIGKYKAIGSGRSYIRDIVLNPEMVRKEFNHLDIEVDKDAGKRSEEYWDQYRTDTLTSRDRRTYQVLDSIGEAENFDKMAKTFQTVMSGQIPWGPIDFDINRVIGYNYYEGLILGMGIHTNDRLSKWFKVGGFYQYSFGISTSKYGGDVNFLLNRRNDVSIDAAYSYDLIESGGVRFFDDKASLGLTLTGDWRNLLIKKLDRTQATSIGLTFRTIKYLLFGVGISRQFKKTNEPNLATYQGNTTILDDEFTFTEVTAGFKWAYKEKFLQTVERKMSMGTKYPIVWLQYSRGIKGFIGGEFDYNRLDLKIRKTFKMKYLGDFTFQFNAGYVDQPIPACNLYNGHGSYRLITLYAPNSFATMRMNEFLSNGYASLYLYQDFKYMLFKGKKWFHPEFALSQNIGFGFLEHKERYAFFQEEVREMNLGYYETGLLINNLVNLKIYTIGIGAFYRWGPYSFDDVGDNFAYKVSVIFPF